METKVSVIVKVSCLFHQNQRQSKRKKNFLKNETIIFLQKKGTEKRRKTPPPNSFTIRPEKLRISTGKQRLQDRQVNRYLK